MCGVRYIRTNYPATDTWRGLRLLECSGRQPHALWKNRQGHTLHKYHTLTHTHTYTPKPLSQTFQAQLWDIDKKTFTKLEIKSNYIRQVGIESFGQLNSSIHILIFKYHSEYLAKENKIMQAYSKNNRKVFQHFKIKIS